MQRADAPGRVPVPVAVVGAGVRTPAGNTVESLWTALCARRSFAEVYRDERLPADAKALVCRVPDLGAAEHLTPVEARRLDRSHVLAVGAAHDAMEPCRAGLPPPERRAVVSGVGLGATATYEEQHARLIAGGLRALGPLTIPMVMPSSVSAHLSLRFEARGPSVTVSAACASGAAAVAEGVELLRRDAADLVLAGGVDSMVTYNAMCSFMRLDVMSRHVEEPELASRPFDVDRDGFVMGEGAGYVALMRCEDAAASGVRVFGNVMGHASNADAHHLVAPGPGGAGALACMRLALVDAGLEVSDVGHVNAHGTSTRPNDLAEAEALTALFGADARPVTAVKGSTGHLIGGSGAVEAIVALQSLRCGQVPPVAGLSAVDPDIHIDAVQGVPRPGAGRYAVSSSFGFGGANTVLVLGTD